MRRQFNHLYEFGPYRLEVQERRLMSEGQAVPLSPKLFDALLLLVEHHGRLLEKEELIKALWPDSFVEEGNLTHYISQLRKALGHDAQGQSYIETVPKRGYRFVAPVREVHAGLEGFLPRHPLAGATGTAEATGAGLLLEDAAVAPPVAETDWLDWSSSDLADQATSGPQAAVESLASDGQPVRRRRSFLLALLFFLGSGAGLAGYQFLTRTTSASEYAASFQRMRPAKLTTNNWVTQAALAPDGKYLAYAQREGTRRSLWIKQTTATNTVQIVPPAEVHYKGVTFSPDGTQVYYVIYEKNSPKGMLYQIPVLGGTAHLLLEDVDSAVAFSPDGKRLCFIRNEPAQHESALLVAKVDGTDVRKLISYKTPSYVTTDGPSWSPDGKLIAYVTGQNGVSGPNRSLVTVRVADGTEQKLAARLWPWIGQVAWLPDNGGVIANAWHEEATSYTDQIWLFAWPQGDAHLLINDLSRYQGVSVSADARALTTIQATRFSRLWIIPNSPAGLNKEATPARAITTGFGDFYSEMFGMVWLPDNRIVYATNASGNTDIWAINASGNQPKQLTLDKRVDMAPTASADGKVIVFVSYRNGTPHLWRMAADGSRAQQLTDGEGEFDPTLSPDGKWVVYTMQMDEQQTLWKVAADGGVPVQLLREPAAKPLISPDGKWLACYLNDPKTKRRTVAILPFERSSEGSAVARFFEQLPPAQGSLLNWSPDSRALTYAVIRAGVSNLWQQPLEGGAPRQLTNFQEDLIYRFAWSPDGKSLACERGITVNDVILLRAGE